MKQAEDFAVASRAELVGYIVGKQGLLGVSEAHLSLVREVEGFGNVVADAVAFEAKAGACAELLQGTASGKDSACLPYFEYFLGKFMKGRG